MSTKTLSAAIRKKYPNHGFAIDENRDALTHAQKEPLRQQIRELNAQFAELSESIRKFNERSLVRNLLGAVQFVLDVRGCDPSIPHLAEAMRPVSELYGLRDQLAIVADKRKLLSSKLTSSRVSVSVWKAGGMFSSQVASGDTFDECEAQIRGREASVVV